jgi:hypothetical protein
MPNFFNYPKIIKNELEKMNNYVDVFDDRPSTSTWAKATIRLKRELVNGYIEKYFEKVLNYIEQRNYDVVLLISGQSLSFSESMIAKIRDVQNQAKFVLYQWDSMKNFPYIKRMHKYFDRIFTFDRKDAREHGLEFLPLFYSEKYGKIALNKRNYKFDFCFVGTAHPQKYKFIKEMSKQLQLFYPKDYIYFYYPSPVVFFYRKIFNQELRKAHFREFHYTPFKEHDLINLISNSKIVLDAPQKGQIGLTIRAIEALGAKRKLITTNADIKNYDFYKSENVYVYDGEFDFENPFFKHDYKEIDAKIYNSYSLNSWLKKLTYRGAK